MKCHDMPQGICDSESEGEECQGVLDSESEEEDELIDMRGEWEEYSLPSKQEKDWREYMRTWSEPVTTLLPKQGLGKGKERMSMEQADELLKTLEFVTFPELEDDLSDEHIRDPDEVCPSCAARRQLPEQGVPADPCERYCAARRQAADYC